MALPSAFWHSLVSSLAVFSLHMAYCHFKKKYSMNDLMSFVGIMLLLRDFSSDIFKKDLIRFEHLKCTVFKSCVNATL